MPVTAILMQKDISDQLSAFGFKGTKDMALSQAIANAVVKLVTTRNMVSCSLNGLMGVTGNITSIAIAGLVPPAMANLMTKVSSFNGRDWNSLCNAVSFGVCKTLQTLTLSGTVMGCATGAGTGKFTSPAFTDKILSGYMIQEMNSQSVDIKGRDMPSLCNALSFGIVMHLQQAPTITVTSLGAVSPTPPYGPISVVQIPSLTTQVS